MGRHDGSNAAGGACPGGEVAVVASEIYEVDRFSYKPAMHEVATLPTRREIALATEVGVVPRAVRCADPDGRAVDVLVICNSGCVSSTWLIRVRDGQATTTRLTPVEHPVAVADGFVGLETAYQPTTGESLMPPRGVGVAAVGWAPRGLMAVTYPPFDRPRKVTPKLIAFDADLRPVASRADVPTGLRTVVGGSLATFNSGRLTVTPVSGPTLEADELLLARAAGVIGLPGGAFTPEAVGVHPPRTPIRIALDGTGSSGPGAGVLALGTLAAAAVVRIVWQARPRRGGQHQLSAPARERRLR